jgi:hypothetical protein
MILFKAQNAGYEACGLNYMFGYMNILFIIYISNDTTRLKSIIVVTGK